MDPRMLTVALTTGWIEPESVFAALLANEDHAFWLDSGRSADSGRSYLGAASDLSRVALASVAEDLVRVRSFDAPASAEQRIAGSIFDYLSRPEAWEGGVPGASVLAETAGASARRVPLGWVGWIGYEAGACLTGVTARTARAPDAALLWVDRLICFDHATRTVSLVVWDSPSARAWTRHTAARLSELAGNGPALEAAATAATAPRGPSRRRSSARTVHWRHDDAAYLRMIDECRRAIHRGDAYQICLTNEVRVEPAVDPLAAYLALRRMSETHHGGLLRFGDFALLSSSPERFLETSGDGRIRTRPIKGTRRRGADAGSDEELRAELATDEKERAENVMIVDLMRNDLSRVCVPGSVEVEALLAVESYPQVHQLVSSVAGVLEPGCTALDALAACFPAGSMTGAPKKSAMTILHDLERGPRGVYAGCFGYLGCDGSADLAMVIRSIVIDPDGASIGTGGGITALSEPHAELAEAKLKAAVLLRALDEASAATSRPTPEGTHTTGTT